MDTERRFEKVFHEQTQYLGQKTDNVQKEIVAQTRWMVGMMLTMVIAVVVTIFLK